MGLRDLVLPPVAGEEKEKAKELAERLGTRIPGGIALDFWALPLIEALLNRIEELEKK